MAFVRYNELTIFPSNVKLRDALEKAHSRGEVIFGIEDDRDLYLIWAAELIENAAKVAGSNVSKQLDTLKRLYRSNEPALSVLRKARLLPAAVPAPRAIEFQAMAYAGTGGETESPVVDRAGVEVKDATLFGWGTTHSDAYVCVFICETKLHQWPCVKSGRPRLCPNGKPWKKHLIR